MAIHLNALQPRGEFHIPTVGVLTSADVWRAVSALPCRRTRATVRAALVNDEVESLPPQTLRAVRAMIIKRDRPDDEPV